jgi:hypothetical protein
LRYLEGWQAGLLAVGIALVGTALAVPWSAEPRDLPMPAVDERALTAGMDADRSRARAFAPELERELGAGTGPLFDLRLLGDSLRAYGHAEAEHGTYPIVRARQKIAESLAQARSLGAERLLALRSYQVELFLAEVRRFEKTGKSSDDLVGLGGPFVEMLERHGWVDAGHAVRMREPLRAILFKRRWNELLGLTEAPFALSVDETRAFYGFLLSHPWVEREVEDSAEACRVADQWRLRKIDELAPLDPSYPHALARGVLLFRLGRYPAAAQAFRDHLASSPDGPYAMRAKNFLIAASLKAEEP